MSIHMRKTWLTRRQQFGVDDGDLHLLPAGGDKAVQGEQHARPEEEVVEERLLETHGTTTRNVTGRLLGVGAVIMV